MRPPPLTILIRPDAPIYWFLRDGSVWRRKLDEPQVWRINPPIPWPLIASRVEIDKLPPRAYHPRPMAFFWWLGAVGKACWDGLTWLVRGRWRR